MRVSHESRLAYYRANGTEITENFDAPTTVDTVAPRLGVIFSYAINKDAVFSEEFEVLPSLIPVVNEASATGDEAIRAGGGSEGRGGASDPKAISCAGHREQIRILCESIRSGSGQPGFIDGIEACAAVCIVESIYKSARSLRAESVFQSL
jgi:hypothetical protein